MDSFFLWLKDNVFVANILITLLATLAFSIILMYVVAFFQGREISFWPPKIGPRLNKLLKKEEHTNIDRDIQRDSKLSRKLDEQALKNNIIYSEHKRLTALASDNEGKFLVIGGFSNKVSAISRINDKVVLSWDHEGIVRAIRFHPTLEAVATASDDGLIQLTYLHSGEFRIVGKHNAPVYDLAFSRDGNTLASGSKDETIKHWDIQKAPIQKIGNVPRIFDPKPISIHKYEKTVFTVDFDLTGNFLAAGGIGGTIKIWQQNNPVIKIVHSNETIFCLRFNPINNLLASSSADKVIKIWNITSREHKLLAGHEDTVRWVCFHPSGKLLASASKDRTVRIWELATARSWVLEGHSDYVYSAEFDNTGNILFSVAGDGTLRRWDVSSRVRLILEGLS